MLSRTRVCEWYARFRDGREKQKDKSSGRQKAVRTPGIETVRELVSTHRRMTEEELKISGETVHKMLVEDLGK
jgi:transposase